MPDKADNQPAVLLVEDDDTIGRHLSTGLRAHGFRIRWCRTGSSALIDVRENPTDLVLLDLGLPDVDGLDVARDLRGRHPGLLIIVLTARGDATDVVAGLDVGADDYLVKPIGLSVLRARLRAHLRRRDYDEVPAEPTLQSRHVVGALTVDAASRRCHVSTIEVKLRPKEFDLLTHLAARPDQAVRREDLMAAVWDENWFGSTKTLDVTMAALRHRLEWAADCARLPASNAPLITTLRGYGYRLEHVAPLDDDEATTG